MAIYRKKPVEIKAWSIKDLISDFENGRELPDEIKNFYNSNEILTLLDGELKVVTLEGAMSRKDGMLIRGVEGEFYPCEQGIFALTYDFISED